MSDKIHWRQVRIDAAIAAMSAMVANDPTNDSKEMAEYAVALADALIIELRKHKTNNYANNN